MKNKLNLPVADIYYIVNDTNKDQLDNSLIGSSYFTCDDKPTKIFKFKDLISKDDSYQELIYELCNLHGDIKNNLSKMDKYKKNEDKIDFEFKFSQGDIDTNLRCNYSFIQGGYCINARTKPPVCPTIEEMDISNAIRTILMSPELKDGLVLITAETGEGKTTTASAMNISRLTKYGGHCNAYEDPVEYLMQGFHGDNGVCIQTNAGDDFAGYIKASLRKFPIIKGSILYVGEIRDHQTANVAMNAAAQGNLVIATIHGMDIQSTLERLLSFAQIYGSKQTAADLLASSLKVIFHQRKTFNPNGKGWTKFNIDGDVMYFLNKDLKEQIKSSMKESDFSKLIGVMEQQKILCGAFNKGNITEEILIRGTHV